MIDSGTAIAIAVIGLIIIYGGSKATKIARQLGGARRAYEDAVAGKPESE
jgi:Sec-independent protein translocase protein TatA